MLTQPPTTSLTKLSKVIDGVSWSCNQDSTPIACTPIQPSPSETFRASPSLSLPNSSTTSKSHVNLMMEELDKKDYVEVPHPTVQASFEDDVYEPPARSTSIKKYAPNLLGGQAKSFPRNGFKRMFHRKSIFPFYHKCLGLCLSIPLSENKSHLVWFSVFGYRPSENSFDFGPLSRGLPNSNFLKRSSATKISNDMPPPPPSSNSEDPDQAMASYAAGGSTPSPLVSPTSGLRLLAQFNLTGITSSTPSEAIVSSPISVQPDLPVPWERPTLPRTASSKLPLIPERALRDHPSDLSRSSSKKLYLNLLYWN